MLHALGADDLKTWVTAEVRAVQYPLNRSGAAGLANWTQRINRCNYEVRLLAEDGQPLTNSDGNTIDVTGFSYQSMRPHATGHAEGK